MKLRLGAVSRKRLWQPDLLSGKPSSDLHNQQVTLNQGESSGNYAEPAGGLLLPEAADDGLAQPNKLLPPALVKSAGIRAEYIALPDAGAIVWIDEYGAKSNVIKTTRMSDS